MDAEDRLADVAVLDLQMPDRDGFGVLDQSGQKLAYVTSGCIRVPPGELPARLKSILEGLREVISLNQPQQVALVPQIGSGQAKEVARPEGLGRHDREDRRA